MLDKLFQRINADRAMSANERAFGSTESENQAIELTFDLGVYAGDLVGIYVSSEEGEDSFPFVFEIFGSNDDEEYFKIGEIKIPTSEGVYKTYWNTFKYIKLNTESKGNHTIEVMGGR